MGEYLKRAKDAANVEAERTHVSVRLGLLQGLIREYETLQIALAEEMKKNEPKTGEPPTSVGAVVRNLRTVKGEPPDHEPEEQK